MEKAAGWLVAACLLAVLIFSHTCSRDAQQRQPAADTITRTRIDTFRDTIQQVSIRIDTLQRTRVNRVTDTFRPYPDTVRRAIDTTELIAAYLQRKAITRTWEDSNLTARLTDTIQFNALQGSTGLDYTLTKETTTRTIRQPRTYLGGQLGATGSGPVYAIQAIHSRPTGRAYSLGYSPASGAIRAGIYFKINGNIPLIP